MFCDRALNGDRPIDVADQDKFVVTEVLSISLVGPTVHEFLPGDLIQVFVRVVDDERKLDVFFHIPTFFDLRASVLHHSRL